MPSSDGLFLYTRVCTDRERYDLQTDKGACLKSHHPDDLGPQNHDTPSPAPPTDNPEIRRYRKEDRQITFDPSPKCHYGSENSPGLFPSVTGVNKPRVYHLF